MLRSEEISFENSEQIIAPPPPPPKSFADKVSDELAFLNVELFNNIKEVSKNVKETESPQSLQVSQYICSFHFSKSLSLMASSSNFY